MLLDPPAGTGWLAVGDAASAYDPISSQGIYKALADGLAAAPAIVAWLDGEPGGIVDYRNGVAERFLEYLSIRSYFYGAERRWEGAPFWQRRRSVNPGEARQRASVR
jgi:flavin-dependent dehydrogenase